MPYVYYCISLTITEQECNTATSHHFMLIKYAFQHYIFHSFSSSHLSTSNRMEQRDDRGYALHILPIDESQT